MIQTIQGLVPYIVLVSHVVFVFLVASIIFRKSWGRRIALFLGNHAVVLSFLISLAAISGSLFYSEGVGFEPCLLCWWQRIFLYPLVFIFAAALWKRNRTVFTFTVPLASLATVIALYHQYVYMGGKVIMPCEFLGGACYGTYVMAFGYITIPMMSLTIALYILLFAWAHKTKPND